MAAAELLCRIIGINPQSFSFEENIILEAELFAQVCEQLKEHYRHQQSHYFRLMKYTTEMENAVLDANFIRYAINDILLSEEYSIEGIAYHTQIPEEVICDVIAGVNRAPSLPLSRRVINLHRSVKPELYRKMMEKILIAYVKAE